MAEALDFEDGGERAIVPADVTEALGARLVALGKLDGEGFRRASRIREETGDRFNLILTKLGLVSDTRRGSVFKVSVLGRYRRRNHLSVQFAFKT